jgi:hypothetical protein
MGAQTLPSILQHSETPSHETSESESSSDEESESEGGDEEKKDKPVKLEDMDKKVIIAQ